MIATTFVLRLGGERVLARVEGAAALARMFRGLYPNSAPGRGIPDVFLRWSGGQGEVFWRDWRAARGRDPERLCAWAEWAVTGEVLRRTRGRSLLLHAAWAVRGGGSVLLAGPHGCGKTTLAAALALRHGWRLLADDMVAVDRAGRPTAVGRPVRFKAGAAPLLPELGLRRRDLELVPLTRFGSGKGSPPLTAILLLYPASRSRPRTSSLAPGLAVANLARLSPNFRRDPGRALRTLADLAGRVPVHVLRGGDLVGRCAAVAGLLPR